MFKEKRVLKRKLNNLKKAVIIIRFIKGKLLWQALQRFPVLTTERDYLFKF